MKGEGGTKVEVVGYSERERGEERTHTINVTSFLVGRSGIASFAHSIVRIAVKRSQKENKKTHTSFRETKNLEIFVRFVFLV